MDVTVSDVRAAHERVRALVHYTPLLSSRALGERIGAEAFLKAESLQRTGSFKVRGALNAIATLTEEQRRAGIVTISAGNHAQAVAYAARATGTKVTVVMPEHAARTKVDATRAYGGDIAFAPDMLSLRPVADALVRDHGMYFLHPFDDPAVIAGQGTVGLEIAEQLPDADLVVVPIGGGGLISGVAVALRALRPGCRIVGVESEAAPAMRLALDAGRPVPLDRLDTIADGLASWSAGDLTLRLVQRHVEDVVLVPETAIVEGMRFVASRARLLVEPAGAAGVAALLAGAVKVRRGGRVVALLSGGNVDLERFNALLAAA